MSAADRGQRPTWRDVDGILLLDKPRGLSSNVALQRARRLFRARKAGHTGSLDPLAEGLLPLCFGQATKISGLLLDADKRYRVRARLGERTATGDAEGPVVESAPVPALTPALLAPVLARFTGVVEQVPPMYSALKHEGQRLYSLAREGVEVERKSRQVVIRELALSGIDGNEIVLDVLCSKGTYIRTLVEDLAAAMGTCGHVTYLERTGVGPFQGRGHALESLAQLPAESLDDLLLPPDAALAGWPAVTLDAAGERDILLGRETATSGTPGAEVRLYGPVRGFLGVGRLATDGRSVAPRRLLVDPAGMPCGIRDLPEPEGRFEG